MKLIEVIQAAGGRISGGDPYLWRCYGDHAQYMEFRDVAGMGYAHCIFDTITYDVREVHLEVPGQGQAFRWIDPTYLEAFVSESGSRNCDPKIAWDDVTYTEVDEATALSYVKDVGEMYYDDLPVPEMA